MMSNLSRLLQLSSPMLPIGAYSYSQGFEWAIESGDATDFESAKSWVEQVLQLYITQFDLALLSRLYRGWQQADAVAIRHWDGIYQAGRDSAETLAESQQMAYSLSRLQQDLCSWQGEQLTLFQQIKPQSFLAIYALTALSWEITERDMLHAYSWSWLENQASVAMKTIPLGQLAGQKMMTAVAKRIPECIDKALQLEDAQISNFCPALTIACCQHETQYSRLFRS